LSILRQATTGLLAVLTGTTGMAPRPTVPLVQRSVLSSHRAELAVLTTGRFTAWSLRFPAGVPPYRITRSGSTVSVFLLNADCPRAVTRMPATRTFACSRFGSEADVTLSLQLGEQIVATPGKSTLTISAGPAAKIVRHSAFRGPKIAANFFAADAVRRANLQETSAWYQAQLASQQNHPSAVKRQASSFANHPPTEASRVISIEPYRAFVGETVSGFRVTLIGRGGDESSADVYTRIYYYTYDAATGAIIEYGDSLADDATARRYGFVANALQVEGK